MKPIEIIAGLIAGSLFVTWILYLAVRCLGSSRDYKDRLDRESEQEYERHIMPKK